MWILFYVWLACLFSIFCILSECVQKSCFILDIWTFIRNVSMWVSALICWYLGEYFWSERLRPFFNLVEFSLNIALTSFSFCLLHSFQKSGCEPSILQPEHLSSPFSSLFNLFVFLCNRTSQVCPLHFLQDPFCHLLSPKYFNCYYSFPFLVILSHLAYLIVCHSFKNCFPFYVYYVYVFHIYIWQIFITNFCVHATYMRVLRRMRTCHPPEKLP